MRSGIVTASLTLRLHPRAGSPSMPCTRVTIALVGGYPSLPVGHPQGTPACTQTNQRSATETWRGWCSGRQPSQLLGGGGVVGNARGAHGRATQRVVRVAARHLFGSVQVAPVPAPPPPPTMLNSALGWVGVALGAALAVFLLALVPVLQVRCSTTLSIVRWVLYYNSPVCCPPPNLQSTSDVRPTPLPRATATAAHALVLRRRVRPRRPSRKGLTSCGGWAGVCVCVCVCVCRRRGRRCSNSPRS